MLRNRQYSLKKQQNEGRCGHKSATSFFIGDVMRKNGLIWTCIVLIVCCLLLSGSVLWNYFEKNKEQEAVAGNNTQMNETTDLLDKIENDITEDIEKEEKETRKIHLMMTGDNLMHLSVVNSGLQADGSRNYDFMFEPIKDYLALADIKITNQETILGGNQLGFSAYPRFNSPTEVGDGIANAGFNVVLHATNHAADKGIEGINNCIDFWEKYPEIVMTGIFKEIDEPNQDIGLLTIDGVTFAILNYTYSPNLSTLPKWLQGHLAMLCDWNKKTGKIDFKTIHPDVLTDIAAAKEVADVVIVCPHWGNEYTFIPTVYQKAFAKQMTEAGADLILGTHPHVIQPIEWIEAENGNRALCYYSLGNYVSTQDKAKTMLEAMAWVTFETDGETVEILEAETGAIPMVYQFQNDYRFGNVYFLDDYTDELAHSHGILRHCGSEFCVENLEKWADEVLGEWRLPSEDVLKEKVDYEIWR